MEVSWRRRRSPRSSATVKISFEHFPEFDTRRLAAGMDVEFVAPIRAGDSITTVSRVKEIYQKTGRSGAMVFIVISSDAQETEWRNRGARRASLHDSTITPAIRD